jgi:hypothetical protein
MKNYIWAPLLAVVLLFAACLNPLDDSRVENGTVGAGTVRVILGGSQARTLLPEASVLEGLYYALRFSAEGKTAVNPVWYRGQARMWNLNRGPGAWT